MLKLKTWLRWKIAFMRAGKSLLPVNEYLTLFLLGCGLLVIHMLAALSVAGSLAILNPNSPFYDYRILKTGWLIRWALARFFVLTCLFAGFFLD